MKTMYQICLIDSDTRRSWTEDYWGSEHARFNDRSEAEQVLAKIQKTYPHTEWEIRELRETYWSETLKKWTTGSRIAPL